MIKKTLKWFQLYWKKLHKDYVINIQSIKLISPYVLLIDFKSDDIPYYLIINGNYKQIRKKYLEQNLKEPISFDEYMDEINLLIPAEDIIKHYFKQWKKKD